MNLAVHLKSIIYIRQNSQIDTAVRKSNVEHLFYHLYMFVQGETWDGYRVSQPFRIHPIRGVFQKLRGTFVMLSRLTAGRSMHLVFFLRQPLATRRTTPVGIT